MECASLFRPFSPASNTECLLSSTPSKLRWMSEGSKYYARKRLASTSNHALRIRSEMTEGGIDIDRRHLLLSSSALGLSVVTSQKAHSEPFRVPEASSCVDSPPHLPDGVSVTCCPPTSDPAVEYTIPTSPTIRTRMAAHKLDQSYINKYAKAIQKMRDLPSTNPHSLHQQANIHCAYCDSAYVLGKGANAVSYPVHSSWFFLPFHRWYMYFFERIVAQYHEDGEKFALPFWNWDAEKGMSIPHMFTNVNSSLYDVNRDTTHQPPKIINLSHPISAENGNINDNYAIIYTQMISTAKTTAAFHGAEYRYGRKDNIKKPGTLESSPHNVVHDWSGSNRADINPNREDMGVLYAAGRDPLFYSHHANVDRMWYVWNSQLDKKGKNYDDPDLLNSKLVFYDEKGKLVWVRAGDCYEISKLGYSYEDLPLPWKTLGRALKKSLPVSQKKAVEMFSEPSNKPMELTSAVTTRVKRPISKRTEKQKQEEEEVLSVEGIELDMAESVAFQIFINFPDANAKTSPANPHFAGTFRHVRHGKGGVKDSTLQKGSFNIGITETLEDVGADEDAEILVTLVPEAPEFRPKTPIKFTTIKIESYKK